MSRGTLDPALLTRLSLTGLSPSLAGEVKHQRCGAEGKPSLNRANKSVGADPKPGDLSMSRLKLP